MKTPLKVSLVCISLNIVLNLILMWPLKQGGIALATVISAIVYNLILFLLLKADLKKLEFRQISISLFKTAISSLAAVFVSIISFSQMINISENISATILSAVIFVLFYFIAVKALNSNELREWLNIFNKNCTVKNSRRQL